MTKERCQKEIEGRVDGTGRKGDCPTLTLVLVPCDEIDSIPMFTWTIGSRVKIIREDV